MQATIIDVNAEGRPGGQPLAGHSMSEVSRRFPIGAEPLPDGSVHFRIWAPRSKHVSLELWVAPEVKPILIELFPEDDGYFSGAVAEARPGMRYKFRLDSGSFPDPVSRFQPEGPHGPSEIVDPNSYAWTDIEWRGVPRERQVIYEMHLGTFTHEGTWEAATRELPELARLGITVLELMPVADFVGRFGWGYDGVNMFAPTRLYGRPDEFRRFVNQAHAAGLGVILDVVYNHFGPDGNYLKEFSEDYFTDRYANEWGEAINFDDKNNRPVREFFISNARYWIEEYHLDGLRLDATQQIFDASPVHILTEITDAVREAGGRRNTYIVGENEPQHTNLIRSKRDGGCGLDALWNDDFHHSAVVALTGHNEAYYSDYYGAPQEFISAAKWGYLYQGQWYAWQKKPRGTPAFGLHPNQFITFVQNHDQVANSLRGLRLHQMTTPGRYKAMTALLLLSPGTPMLFQGQEFAATTPFYYFADHHPELAKMVAKGRREFLSQFKTIACPENEPFIKDPASEDTFKCCILDFSERQKNASVYKLHESLLKLRREDPVFSSPRLGSLDGAVLGAEAFCLRFFAPDGKDRLILVNFGRDVRLGAAPEPLLAPVGGCKWRLIWSSEDPVFGGCGTPELEGEGEWVIPGHACFVLAPEDLGTDEVKDGKAHSANRSAKSPG